MAPPATLSMDLVFHDRRPGFNDLFRITGTAHPAFPPEGVVDFSVFDDLAVSQINDFFGVRTLSGKGTDVAIWLYPLVGDKPVDHHPGPFDGLRPDYDLLGNPDHRLPHFLKMLGSFLAELPVTLIHKGKPSSPASIARIAKAEIANRRKSGIETGSPGAMALDT